LYNPHNLKAKGVRLRKLLVSITIFLLAQQFASAKSIFNEFNTEVLKIDGRYATIKSSDNIVVGSSGIVTHTFENGDVSVLARADVTKIEKDKATIKFQIFKLSTQDAFPKPGLLPAVGDKVTLNYLYNRALIVAPNYNVYSEVTKHFTDVQWVHPDIVGAYLAKISRPNPDKKIFQKVCTLNSASLIFFALSDNGYFVDCSNFKTIKTVKTGFIKTAQVPFYTRISEIQTSWLTWAGSYIHNYNKYYRTLIGK